MKLMMLLVVGFAAFLSPSTYAVEPSLASVMERFSKEPRCGANFMGVRFTLIAKPPNQSYRFIDSDGTFDVCLERREIIGMAFPRGAVRDGSYYEFKASGTISLNDTIAPPAQTARYELTLGQPPTGFMQKRRPDLGTLVITYRNGTRQRFALPDSLTITAVGRFNHFIYGEIGGGAAVISLLIAECGLEGCGRSF